MQLPVSARVEAKINEIVKRMGGGRVEIGFMDNATYPDGTPVAQVAFWNEFGHGGHFPAPPRPFFRNMISAESPGWPALMARLAKGTNYDGPKVLAIMGQTIMEELQESIENFNGAPLSPTTLLLRARFWSNPQDIKLSDVLQAQRDVAAGATGATGTQATPLLWTKQMRNSVTYKVMR